MKTSLTFILVYLLCVYSRHAVQVCHGMGVGGQLCEASCLLPSLGLEDQTQVLRLAGTHLFLPSHLTLPGRDTVQQNRTLFFCSMTSSSHRCAHFYSSLRHARDLHTLLYALFNYFKVFTGKCILCTLCYLCFRCYPVCVYF